MCGGFTRAARAKAWMDKGFELEWGDRYEETLQAFGQAIRIDPDNASAYSRKGIILVDLGRLEEALQAYDKVIAIKSDYVHAWNNKGFSISHGMSATSSLTRKPAPSIASIMARLRSSVAERVHAAQSASISASVSVTGSRFGVLFRVFLAFSVLALFCPFLNLVFYTYYQIDGIINTPLYIHTLAP
jgi:tetratricopeptide (TPR) repeat protein